METIPTAIRRDSAAAIVISWSDGTQTRHAAAELRKRCPCATCREKKASDHNASKPLSLPVLSLAEAQPVTITRMQPIGNYAYNIAFSDGHDSGIFTFEFLREAGQA